MTQKEYIATVNAAKQHSYNYYVLSAPTISDAEFDRLVDAIEQTEHEHPEWTLPDSPTQQVGSDLGGNGRRTISHRTPMLSCQKAQDTAKVTAWVQKLTKKLGHTPEVMLSWKADGISCSLVYQDGQLIEASTRGDGSTGQDLMQHVRLMQTVPQTVIGADRIEVRGEIVCPKVSLQGMNDRTGKQYADCRSAASSLCNQDSPSPLTSRLEFWAWDVIIDGRGYDWQQDDMPDVLQSYGFAHNCYLLWGTADIVVPTLLSLTKRRHLCPIPVDGVVIRLNNNNLFQAQGFTDHHPKGSIAYKFPPQTTLTTVRRIEITVGATGRRTPVAWFDPVTILGRTVEKASLGSEDTMRKLGVTEGARVEVGLSNDVIPKVYRVVA